MIAWRFDWALPPTQRRELMQEIFTVTIQGRKLESRDLRQLLARAVREKRGLKKRGAWSLGESCPWQRIDVGPSECPLEAAR